jgi:ribosomal protein S19E (S16A)
MMAFEAMEQERMAFLSELYIRSTGDARQGVPYEALIDALGFDERVTKRIQRALQREGLVELTDVPRMTTVGRTVMDHAQRQTQQQTIAMTPQGMRLMEDLFAYRADMAYPTPSAPPPA